MFLALRLWKLQDNNLPLKICRQLHKATFCPRVRNGDGVTHGPPNFHSVGIIKKLGVAWGRGWLLVLLFLTGTHKLTRLGKKKTVWLWLVFYFKKYKVCTLKRWVKHKEEVRNLSNSAKDRRNNYCWCAARSDIVSLRPGILRFSLFCAERLGNLLSWCASRQIPSSQFLALWPFPVTVHHYGWHLRLKCLESAI